MRRVSVTLASLMLLPLLAASAGAANAPAAVYRGVSPVDHFDISPPLRAIPPLRPVGGEEPGREVREGMEGEDRDKPLGPQDVDTSVQNWVGSGEIPAPLVSFDGPSNISSVAPPDPVGDVGPNHYVAMSNLSFQVFSKTGTSLYGPALNNTLWAGFGGACQTENSGDPIVLYDQIADRWMLSQFTSAGPTYYNCVAVSTTSDPTGSYYRWAFTTGTNFPDYPKYGWWSDGLYISTREFAGGSTFAGVGAYAIKRADLIGGNPAAVVISFLAGPSPAYNVGDGLLPTDMDGFTPPPAGTPNFFVGSMDNGGPYGATQDALTLWKFTADFVTPGNSSLVLANTIPIAAYDTIPAFCSGRACVPQPGTAVKIDHLGYRQRPLHRLAYRNFGTHESLVTNQSVEASATVSGIRWWEIRSPNSSPVVYQEGTYAPGTVDSIHRWMGSLAMDSAGNMALGYSASDGTATFPSSWYTGRLAADPLGTMPQGEGSIFNGTGSQTSSSNRWGDYTSMNVDPVDDCTFWYVNEYLPTTSSVGWRLRIGSFKFDQCGTPDFYLAATPESQEICVASNAVYNVNIGSISGYNAQVTLSTSGNPGSAGFNTNPVTPPGSSTLTISGAAAGIYNFNVVGTAAGPNVHQDAVGLTVQAAAPGVASLATPVNGALNVAATPIFTWGAVAGASTYSIDVATDAGFSSIVASATGLAAATWTSNVALATSTQHFWRVRATNACGTSSNSSVFSFTTVAAPGDCGPGTIANIAYQYGFEAGAGGWTHSGTGDSWALSATNPHSGTSLFHANDPAVVSDQRLVSPAVALPSGQNPVVLKFWHLPNLENSGTTACYDGGILEVSTDGGTVWTQVLNANLLVGPYTGLVSASFSNPLAGLSAWCNGSVYILTVADVSAYAGQTAQFRLRLGSDTSASDAGWDVDDVVVQSCALDLTGLFSDGFESGNTSLWSSTVP